MDGQSIVQMEANSQDGQVDLYRISDDGEVANELSSKEADIESNIHASRIPNMITV